MEGRRPKAAPTANHRVFRETAGGASPSPTCFQKGALSWGGEPPWGFHRGHAPGSQRAGEGTRPYGGGVVRLGGASGRPRPTKGSAGGSGPRPCGGVWIKNGGRTMCAPTGEGAETWPLIRPSVRTGAPVPIPSVPSGHLPLTRGVGPQGEGLGKTKRDRSLTCPLKHRGETKFRTKFLCFLSFSKKGSYTGPWRKRSIISWVREMAEPPWGRFSRSNQVPSPSSSSWRVTVSSSVSRSQ